MKEFVVEVIPDMFHDQAKEHISSASSRVATISGLASGTAHTVRVVAVYHDDARAESNVAHFTTPCTYMFENTHVAYTCLCVQNRLFFRSLQRRHASFRNVLFASGQEVF